MEGLIAVSTSTCAIFTSKMVVETEVVEATDLRAKAYNSDLDLDVGTLNWSDVTDHTSYRHKQHLSVVQEACF
jgi:hypothetical protein